MGSQLEVFYPFVPVWAQNLGISVYGLAWRWERLGGQFDQYVREFQERDAWTRDEFNHYLEERMRWVLVRAFTEVPYYARKWRAEGVDANDLARFRLSDLTRLPSTQKKDLRADPEMFISSAVKCSARLHRYYSSGTTGTPITAVCTTDGHRRFIAAREARSFGWAGTSLRNSRSMIGGRMVVPRNVNKPPFHRYNRAEKQLYFSAYRISPANVPHYVAALNSYQPRVFTGYAHSHYLLASMMLDQGMALAYEPDALILGSESLTAEMKTVLRQSFRARAYEEYGCVENCVLATECEHGRLHVSPDFGLVEIVDDQGQPLPPGVEGRILCTSLLNEAQPLIRYETGDLGGWSTEPCPCGRNHLPVIEGIVGRLEDIVVAPNGARMVRFHGIFVGLPSVIEGQVIQEALDRFTVKLVARSGFGEGDEQLIRERFNERLGVVRVAIQQVTEIPRTERGKFRAVISNLKGTSRPSQAT